MSVVLLVRQSGTKVFTAAATPNWRYLLAGLVICAAVQPLRALAWTSTVRSPVGFRAMYTASAVGSFFEGAAVPKRIMLRAGALLVLTWVARWFGVLFLLHAVGVHVGVGSALLYMVVTGLANTMPFLPGNVGLYQGAAIGALAMAGHSGDTAITASVFTPAAGSLSTAAAALVGLAFYGRRVGQLSRAAVRF